MHRKLEPMPLFPPARVAAIFLLSVFLAACGGASKESPTAVASPDQTAAEAPPSSRLAVQTRFRANDTLIPLSDGVLQELAPEARFSLGLDRMVRSKFEPLHHKGVLVVTNRLAVDSEGVHLLESLLMEEKPLVKTVVLFNDELPTPGRSAALDRILAAFPEVRVFERGAFCEAAEPAIV